jgi:adenine-specific DNA methylase
MKVSPYPKRLIEVDLPIKRISAHARREKSIRHGHISTLHIWWARRPLAACRAVICAALWPDPADVLCPREFRDKAARIITEFAKKAVSDKSLMNHCSRETWEKWQKLAEPQNELDPKKEAHLNILRFALLDFIADFANWDSSTVCEYLDTSRALTQAAHEALGGAPGTRPLVVDPFAGGGSIPLEALRVGADAFASDLNPVAVLINKVVLEYIPKYGQRLADEVRKWGEWIKREAEKELAEFYPKDADGATPIAYLWARTIQCEGPGCGAELPLIGQTWLSTKDVRKRAFALSKSARTKSVAVTVVKSPKEGDVMSAISKKSSATCPLCGYTTPAKRVREVLSKRNGGSDSARLLAVVTTHPHRDGKDYRAPHEQDLRVLKAVGARVSKLEHETLNGLPAIPHEDSPPDGALGFRFQKYGIRRWRDLYTQRQLVALTTLARLVTSQSLRKAIEAGGLAEQEQNAVLTCLALAVGRVNDLCSTLCRWLPSLEAVAASNGSQNKMPMILDFVEVNPTGGAGGDWSGQIDWIVRVIHNLTDSGLQPGNVARSPAQEACLPDDIAAAMVTDPPYYSAFGYSDLSEFFFPWLRRSVPPSVLSYNENHVPKAQEAISIGKTLSDGRGEKNDQTYLDSMGAAFQVSRRVVRPDGVGVVVFANKTTAGWEAILEAMIGAGWMVSASWPIDTERPNRQRAIGAAALQSSVHLVCRPRENPDGSVRTDEIGDWRDVLQELPRRIHEWMPRLAEEGVVGADAIFACLGPALEIFSRYSRVEKASGEVVALKEYLEQVWGAVAKEALALVFKDADTTGFEEDARLTAMWLWTLSTANEGNGVEESEDEPEEEDETSKKTPKMAGFILEYDAARKIAQGLGAHLEQLASIVEVKGEKARLLPVSERTRYLFGRDDGQAPERKRKKQPQRNLFADLDEIEETGSWGTKNAPKLGDTVLDRIHQSMILFAAGRSDALKRFLVEDGVGRDQRFWTLAQALSALYPPQTDEKRWVDGVLARKKGMGF